jgi:hypothetical protein
MEYTRDIEDLAICMSLGDMSGFKTIVKSWEFRAAVTTLNPLLDNNVNKRYWNYGQDLFWIVNSVIILRRGELSLTDLLCAILSIDDSICYLPWNLSQVLPHFIETKNGFFVIDALK